MSLIELEINLASVKVWVDEDFAEEAVKGLDIWAEKEKRSPIQGKVAIKILAEYGLVAHVCSSCPKNLKLAIVIDPPSVYFCPSRDGLHGIFIEPYEEKKHGDGTVFMLKNDLFSYTNIQARLDGWAFAAGMFKLGNGHKPHKEKKMSKPEKYTIALNDRKMKYLFAFKGGILPSEKGRGNNQGRICHAIATLEVYPDSWRPSDGFIGGYSIEPALCGAKPGKRGFGWLAASREQLNCPKCIKLLKKAESADGQASENLD